MTQNCDDHWSEDRLQVLEETRLLGNNFYKRNQYRAAALLYRTGLGIIVPGNILPNFFNESIAKDAPEEVDKQYFTLLINLAQALLNLPPRDMHRELAAMGASVACEAATFHLRWVLMKWHGLRFADFVRQLQHTTCPPELAHYGSLLAKARSRRCVALERCGNISGAVSDHLDAFGKLPAGIMEQDRLDRIVLGYDSPESGLMLPQEAMRVFARTLECCHRADVDFIGIDHVALKHCATPLGEMTGAFSCGNYWEAAVFVTSYSRADNTGANGFIIGNWRGTGGSVMTYTWGACTPRTPLFLQSGAVLGSVLYCISLAPGCCEIRGFHLLSSYNISAGFQVPLQLAPTAQVPLARRDTALVACHGALYMFGGCVQEDRKCTDRVASQDMIILTPKLSRHNVECALLQTDQPRPPARWGHATFAHGSSIYIFGGMYERQEGSKTWDVYLGDMWELDVKSRTWLKLGFYSCAPCARAHMGVAFDKGKAMIVGGVTAKPDGKKMYLADVWEFDFQSFLWVQVVPEKPSEDPWISARSGAACGLVNGNTLVTLGGVGRYGPVGRDDMTHFTVKRGTAVEFARKAGIAGPQKDGALMRACAKRVQMRLQVATLPDPLRSMCAAPAGSVNLLAIRSLDLSEGAFAPLCKSQPLYGWIIPSDCIFSPEGIQPIRPLGGGTENLWGSMECPFDLAPRWLKVPYEFSINLASGKSESASKHNRVPVSLRQTVKQFGTVKAAVEYFKLCQPQVHLSRWRRVEVLDGGDNRTPGMRWKVQECEACATEVDQFLGGRQQLYIMAVVGPVFFAFMATRYLQVDSVDASSFCSLLFNLQVSVLCNSGFTVSTHCHHCGEGDPPVPMMETGARPKMATKVCRGCHLVRYCGSECQRADWGDPYGHKAVCKKYASRLPKHRVSQVKRMHREDNAESATSGGESASMRCNRQMFYGDVLPDVFRCVPHTRRSEHKPDTEPPGSTGRADSAALASFAAAAADARALPGHSSAVNSFLADLHKGRGESPPEEVREVEQQLADLYLEEVRQNGRNSPLARKLENVRDTLVAIQNGAPQDHNTLARRPY
ncbi:probable Tip elongation aberrant protein 1 at N-terminal half [Coccomyxa sp. Obi]|nr:probable Tip elongation aberrant protein 1 at N-terminal half [Coccomyxa sp. Obi]